MMKFGDLKVGSQVVCPIPEHGIHTVTAIPKESSYEDRIGILRFGHEPSHYAQFDDGSMISEKNSAIAEFELVPEPPC